MYFPFRGPRWFVAGATLAMVVVCGFRWSSEHREDGRVTTRVNGAEAVEGEVLVKYRDGRHGWHLIRSTSLRTSELLSRLAQDRAVEFAEPNYLVRLLNVPNDPSFASLWGLFNNGFNPVGGGGVAGSDIDAPAAWDVTTGSRRNVIGVMDTGIDYKHWDLAANVWSAPASFQVTIGGVTITCAAGTHGFNAVARTCDPMDDHAHGTHVAGIIGARGNNATGVTGVNWMASMMAIKVLGASGSGTVSDVVAGLQFAVQAKAAFAATNGARIRVLSNSWASGAPSTALRDAIDAANSADMLFVTAAGNGGSNNDATPVYPGSYPLPNLVTVAASTSADQRAPFSNYGATSVHLAAPGSAVMSTVPGNAYMVSQGTSMATAHVSGAALLALSMCSVTTQELRTLLLNSVDRVPAFSGVTTTGGRLNVRRMVQDCPRPTVTGLTLTSDLASPQPLGKTVTWTAIAGGGQGPYTYRWMVEVSPDVWWSSPWGSSNTFAWTPTALNPSYRVLVGVRSAWNTNAAAELTAVKPYAIQPPVTGATLTSDVAAPQNLGTTVTWTASATGGQAPYEYQFQVWDGTVWTITRPWAASNTFAWTPAAADPDYQVAVQVRSAWNEGVAEVASARPFAIRVPIVTAATLTPNLPSPRADGTTVRWQATASGGKPPYQYRFVVFDGSVWTEMTDWTTSSTFDWTPFGSSDRYQVAVRVRSAGNTGTAEFTAFQNYVITRVALTAARVLFEPSAPGETVDYYRFDVFAGGANPEVATPIATQNLGRPAQPCTECSADVSSSLLPLPQGYYLATVTAVGPGVAYRSDAFRFIR